MERRISGTTRLLGLFGSPVSHSGSPAMYNYSFQKLGLDYVYLAFDIGIKTLPDAVSAAKVFGMKGFNLTMPCKTDVIRHLDQLSPAAELIGAVNTVVVDDDGIMTGNNTDGKGFVLNLKDHGVTVKGKKITILGGGGAATAIQVQAALDGANEISIFNARDSFFGNITVTAEKISKAVPGCKVSVYDLEDTKKLYEEISMSQILIHATRIGMRPLENQSLIRDITVFHKDLAVADVVYNPRDTKLLKDARNAGCDKVIGGIGMLLWQGAEAFKLYTGLSMPVGEVKELFFN